MGQRSRYSDDQWDAAFAREKAGARRVDLAAELGVSIGTMNWQARKRGIRRGATEGWADRRRRPEGGWPAGHVFAQSRSGMTPDRWDAVLARYVAGEPVEALTREYGVSAGALSVQARQRGMRKMDQPGAVWRTRGPAAAAPGAGGAGAGRAGLAFDYDPDDPDANAAALTALETAAAREGRAADFLTLRRMRRAMRPVRGEPRADRPALAFDFDPEDEEKTLISLCEAMHRAVMAARWGDGERIGRMMDDTLRFFRRKATFETAAALAAWPPPRGDGAAAPGAGRARSRG